MNKTEDQYWIKPGVKVKQKGTQGPKMTVDNLVIENSGKKRKVLGVKCHWVDKEHKYQTGQFHTKELVQA